jgi:phage shock protein C
VETASRARKLVRSQDDRVLAGVCGGLGDYLSIDPVWVRLGTVLSTLVWGLGLILYAILWITLPEQPDEDGGAELAAMASDNPRAVAGVLLLVLGLLILLWKILSLLTFKVVIPVILIGMGLFLLLHRRR